MEDKSILTKCYAVSAAVLMIAVGFQLVSGQASAETSWNGHWPEQSATPNVELTTRAEEPTGHGEVTLSARMTDVVRLSDRYEVRLQAMIAADTLGKIGYTVSSSTFSGSLPLPWNWLGELGSELAENEGLTMDFPTTTFYPDEFGNYDRFTFPYYGKTYDKIFISENGYVAFGQQYEYSLPTPQATYPDSSNEMNGVVAPLWRDLDTRTGAVYYGLIKPWEITDWGSFVFVLIWENVKNLANDNLVTFGLYLGEDGRFEFRYKQVVYPDIYYYHNKPRLIPTSVGFEDQFAHNGYLMPTENAVSGVKFLVTPTADSHYYIDSVRFTAWKKFWTPKTGLINDGNAMVELRGAGMIDDVPGTNIRLENVIIGSYSGVDPALEYMFNLGYAGLTFMVDLYCPPAGLILNALGLIVPLMTIEDYYARIPYGGVDQGELTDEYAEVFKEADDWGAHEVYFPSPAHELYLSPYIVWEVLGTPDEVGVAEHRLELQAVIEGHSQTSSFTITTEKLKYTFDRTNYAPIASIVSVSPNNAPAGTMVSFDGSSSDIDGNVASRRWWSSIDGDLGTLEDFSSSMLSPGVHTINYQVTDNDGALSNIASTTLTVTGSASVKISDDFTDGDISDWIQVETGGSVDVVTDPNSKKNVVMSLARGTSATGGTSALKGFSSQTGHLIAEAKLMVSTKTTNKWAYFILKDGGSSPVHVTFKDGYIQYYDGGWKPLDTPVAYRANTWYTIKVDVDIVNKQYDIYVNGVLKKNNAAFYGSSSKIDGIYFQPGWFNVLSSMTMWVDDVNVSS